MLSSRCKGAWGFLGVQSPPRPRTEARKERTYPEFGRAVRCRLVVLGTQVGGRWSAEAANFVGARAHSVLIVADHLVHLCPAPRLQTVRPDLGNGVCGMGLALAARNLSSSRISRSRAGLATRAASATALFARPTIGAASTSSCTARPGAARR